MLHQVSDKERKLQYDTLFKDIASVLVAKCVNSETNRPYTISMLERSLKDIHFAVDPKRGAKQQALDVSILPPPPPPQHPPAKSHPDEMIHYTIQETCQAEVATQNKINHICLPTSVPDSIK